MIGYVLLLAFAVVISALIYSWIKTYVPRDAPACPDSVSIYIKDYNYTAGYELTVLLKNNGKFNIDGIFIHATNSSSQEVATVDLSQNLTAGGNIALNSVVFFTEMKPGEERTLKFERELMIYSIEIIPAREQIENNKNRLVSCSKAKAEETLVVA